MGRILNNLQLVFLTTFLIAIDVSAGGSIAGKVTIVKGQVFIVRGSEKIQVVKDITILESDIVESNVGGTARITMIDSNLVDVYPKSKVEIAKYVYKPNEDKKNVELKVDFGKIKSTVNQKYDGANNKFQVKTPSAVAGVRGTVFTTEYDAVKKVSKVVTIEGLVAVAKVIDRERQAPPVFVKPNQVVNVDSEQARQEKPRDLKSEDRETLKKEDNDLGYQYDPKKDNKENLAEAPAVAKDGSDKEPVAKEGVKEISIKEPVVREDVKEISIKEPVVREDVKEISIKEPVVREDVKENAIKEPVREFKKDLGNVSKTEENQNRKQPKFESDDQLNRKQRHLEDDQSKKQKRLDEEQAKKQKQLEEEQAKKQKQLEEEQAKKQKQLEEEQAKKQKQLEEEQAKKQKQLEEEQAKKQKQLEEEQAKKQKQLEEKQARKEQLAEEMQAKKQKHLEEAQARKQKRLEEEQAKRQQLIEEAARRREEQIRDKEEEDATKRSGPIMDLVD